MIKILPYKRRKLVTIKTLKKKKKKILPTNTKVENRSKCKMLCLNPLRTALLDSGEN